MKVAHSDAKQKVFGFTCTAAVGLLLVSGVVSAGVPSGDGVDWELARRLCDGRFSGSFPSEEVGNGQSLMVLERAPGSTSWEVRGDGIRATGPDWSPDADVLVCAHSEAEDGWDTEVRYRGAWTVVRFRRGWCSRGAVATVARAQHHPFGRDDSGRWRPPRWRRDQERRRRARRRHARNRQR